MILLIASVYDDSGRQRCLVYDTDKFRIGKVKSVRNCDMMISTFFRSNYGEGVVKLPFDGSVFDDELNFWLDGYRYSFTRVFEDGKYNVYTTKGRLIYSGDSVCNVLYTKNQGVVIVDSNGMVGHVKDNNYEGVECTLSEYERLSDFYSNDRLYRLFKHQIVDCAYYNAEKCELFYSQSYKYRASKRADCGEDILLGDGLGISKEGIGTKLCFKDRLYDLVISGGNIYINKIMCMSTGDFNGCSRILPIGEDLYLFGSEKIDLWRSINDLYPYGVKYSSKKFKRELLIRR